MEEEKLMEDEAKKQKERNNEVGGQNFTPPHSLTQQKLSQLSQPKKKSFTKFSSIFQNPNFQFKNFHSQAFNFTFSMPKF